jgi:hypothetical protein
MKIKSLSLLVTLLVLSVMSYAQDEMFKVLASKGANKFSTGSSADQKAILIGKKLFKDDKIIVGENSYLGLAHKSGKTIELKKPGTYEVSKLSSEVASQNAGVAKKYVDFVAGEINSTDEDMAKNRHKYMAVTGSVERDVKKAPGIKLLTPKDAYTLSTPVTLRWVPNFDATSTYVVTVTDLADSVVYSVETKDDYAVVDLDKLDFKTQRNLMWKVSTKGKPAHDSESAILKYVEEDKANNLEKQVAQIKSELNEETALNKYILASFYEENGLLLDALANYEAAIKLESDVDDYKVAYGKFLEKNKLAPVATK